MESNPYHSPSANLFGSSATTTAESVPAEAIRKLQGTKPWLRFFGVIMWIAVAFMLLGGVGVIIAGVAGVAAGGGSAAALGGAEAGLLIGVAAAYIVMSFLYIYPAIKIWKSGSAIKRLISSRQPEDLIAALEHQRAFWKFCGIMTILLIVLYIGIIVVMGLGAFGAINGIQGLELPAPTE